MFVLIFRIDLSARFALAVYRAEGQKDDSYLGSGGRPMKILCPRCHVGRIDRERCNRCGYRASRAQEEQERMGRLLRNSLIGLVSLLAGVWLVRLL
jgi:hypothetical protein